MESVLQAEVVLKRDTRDILLIYPEYTYPRKSPPLGLACLASFAEEKGYSPRILDFNVEDMKDGPFERLLRSRDWLLVGISFMTNQFAEAARIAAVMKRVLPQTLLAAGGPHPSSVPDRTLREIPALDAVVRGEGEETLCDLAEAATGQKGCDGIAGVCFRRGEKIVDNGCRELLTDLDALPYPGWRHLTMAGYSVFSIDARNGGVPVFALLSSRGCPNECVFCDSHTIFGRRFRARSAGNLVAEIMDLHEKFGMLQFDFVDDLFTLRKDRVLEFCERIRRTGVPFRWMANARVNTVDRQMLQAMKDAGCIRVDFGVETGDPVVRRLMRKNITDEQIVSAHKTARDAGLSTGSFVMVGNLGETKNSARMTVDLMKEIGDDVMVAIACPFPGTELYRIATDKGWINTEDWGRYVTSPTYTADYRPVMRTEHLSEEDILRSFYYIHSFFFLRPNFYREWVFRGEGMGRRFRLAFALLKSRLRRGAG